MGLLTWLRRKLPEDAKTRILWHKLEGTIGALIYGVPSWQIRVIGVTGTDGKTTTSHMIASVLQAAGKKVGLSSTTHFQIGANRWENQSHQTTPGRFYLHRLLRRMVREKCSYAVLEISSHALHQGRVTGIALDCAVLTNVTHEHFEYHRTFEKYVQAKTILFKRLKKTHHKRNVPKVAVINLDSPQWDTFIQLVVPRRNVSHYSRKAIGDRHDSKVEVYGYTVDHNKKAKTTETVWASDIHATKSGTAFQLHIQNTSIAVNMSAIGNFNVSNALAAAAVCYSQGVSLEVIAHGLHAFQSVPGRMERIDEGQAFEVYVDFAVTPAALENVLRSLRAITSGKLISVFGGIGHRDKSKRPMLGELAATLADVTIVTDDEPYSDDPATIRKEILKPFYGLEKKKDSDFFEIPDRREAILFAFQQAKSGDTIVITGMGNFNFRMIGDTKLMWDDREVARECIREIRNMK